MHSVTYRQTDRQMDDRMMPTADHTVHIAVRSANNVKQDYSIWQ